MIYTTFAQLYDKLMDPQMYRDWVSYFDRYEFEKNSNILDLACGSGRFAVEIAKKGYDVTGFDLSEEMLSLAYQHSYEENIELTLVAGDMQDLSGLEKYNVVTCFADSLCYLTNKRILKNAFREVKQHLKKDGVFLFDVITPYKTDKIYPGYMYNYSDDEQTFVWTTYLGEYEHSVEHDLTFFIFDESINAYKKVNELHKERTYELRDYIELLKEAGFNQIEVSAEFGREDIEKQTERWFFKCSI